VFVVKGEKFLVLTETEKRVVGYIKEYRKKGYSNEKIKSALLKSGVSQAIINKCFKIASSKVWLFVLFSLLVIGALVLGYFLLNEVECVSDRDCGTGYDCQEGECILVVEEDECTFDADCDDGFECSRGECSLIEEEEPECYFDMDCDSGYDCESGVCERAGIEPQCGDGECVTGEESCYLDCGCTTNAQCQENDANYLCGSSGQCYYSIGISGGSDSSSGTGTSGSGTSDTGTTASVCDDVTCSDSSFVCYESTGVCGCDSDTDCFEGEYCDEDLSGYCVELEICDDNIDNDLDGLIDSTGGCDINGDGIINFVCGCYNPELGFSLYSDCNEENAIDCIATLNCDTEGDYPEIYGCFDSNIDMLVPEYNCVNNLGIYYGADSDCEEVADVEDVVECDESDCGGYSCQVDGSCYDFCDEVGDKCAEGYECSENGICVEEACTQDSDCTSGVCEEFVCVECFEDSNCVDGYECSENVCVIESEVCDNLVDDNADSGIDYYGGCEIADGDDTIDYVCGCIDSSVQFPARSTDYEYFGNYIPCSSGYEYGCGLVENDYDILKFEDLTCGTGEDIEGTYYGADEQCVLECTKDSDCTSGVCEEFVCVEEEEEDVELICSNVLPECADGVDNDEDGKTDLEDEECTDWEAEESGVIVEEDEDDEVIFERACNDLDDNDADGKIDYYGVCEYLNPSFLSKIVSCSELVDVSDYSYLSDMYYDCKDECDDLDGETTMFDIGCNSPSYISEKNIGIEIVGETDLEELIWKEILIMLYDPAQIGEWKIAEMKGRYSNYHLSSFLTDIDEVKDLSIIEEIPDSVFEMIVSEAVEDLKDEYTADVVYEMLLDSNLPIDYAAVSVVDVYGEGSIDTLAGSLKDLGITPIQSAVIAMNLGVDIDDFLSTAGFTEQEILVAKEVVTQYEVVYFVAEGMSYSRIDDSVIKSNLDAAGVESDIVVLAIKNIDLDLSIVVAGTGIGLNIAQGMDLQNVINTNSFSKKAFAPEDESLWDRIKDFFMDAYSAL